MNFNPLVSFNLAGLVQRVWAQLGRVAGAVQRFALVRWRVARICWRDFGKAWSKSSAQDDADTAYLGGWWWQSPETQRTTVRRRAGV